MKNGFQLEKDGIFLIGLVLFLVTSLSAVNYFNSDGVFDANIMYVNNVKAPYSVLFNIESLVGKNLNFDIEVIYKKQNLVVGSELIRCSGTCEGKIELSKVFFDDYEIVIRTSHKGRHYEKNLDFTLQKPDSSFTVDMQNIFFIETGKDLHVTGTMISDIANRQYRVDVYPKAKPDQLDTFNVNCISKNCDFDFNLKSNIFIGDYMMNIYSEVDSEQKGFKTVLLNNSNSGSGSSSSKRTLYDSRGNFINADVVLSSNGKVNENFPLYNKGKSKLLKQKQDVEFKFNWGKLKSLKVSNTTLENVSIGYEEVPIEKVNLLNTVSHAFAIDPHVPDDVEYYTITFEATGYAVLKCSDYNFSEQNCFGSYEKILDTVPGQIYTINLTPTDPILAQVNDYILSPTGAACQDTGGGWASGNCVDSSYSGSTLCDSSSGEYTYCDDTFIETHTMKKNSPAGVRMYFEDTSQDRCEAITKVEVLYKQWYSSVTGTRTISIDADGDGWTPITFTSDGSEPVSDRVVDVTSSLPGGETWDCADFFQTGATAGLESYWITTGGNPNTVYTLSTDTLVYRVAYEYTQYPLETDKNSYTQGETITITGSDIWNPSATVSINLTLSNGTVEQLADQSVNASGEFSLTYDIGDYYPLGTYSLFAIQNNDSSKNSSKNFTVTIRYPLVSSDKDYFSKGEKILFDGLYWIKNDVVNISQTFPSGIENPSFSDSVSTDANGEFNYNWTAWNDFVSETGIYIFNFSEDINQSYFDSKEVTYVFRPASASIGLADINESDNADYDLGGGGGTQTMDIGFGQTLPTTGATLDSYVVYLKYATAGATTWNLQWLNDGTGTYQDVCSFPASASKTIVSCDLSTQVQSTNDQNSVNIRLVENGGPSEHWLIDFVYVMRNFTINPPNVTLINPANDTWFNYQDLWNLTYNVTSSFFDIAYCDLYIDGSLNQTDNTITNDITQTFTLSSNLNEGKHTWMVSCVEDSTKLQRGNSSIFDIVVDLTVPSVSLDIPVNQTLTNQNTISYSANFTDNLGLENVSLYVWNSAGTLIGTNSTNVSGVSNSTSLNLNFPSEGTYYWNYLSYDRAGNSNFALDNFTIDLDLTGPDVTLDTPSNGTKTNILNQQFNANFTDNYELYNATLQVYNSVGTLIGTNSTSISGLSNSSTLGFTLPGEGTYYWNYLVYDKAGNSNVSVSNYTLYIDTTNPVVNLTNPANDTWHNSDVWFKGDFEDPASGLKNATLYIWDSVGTLIHTNSTSISNFVNSSNMSYSFASEGTYYWNYEVYDIAGNSGWNSTNHSVNIDLSGPVVNLTTPANNSYVNLNSQFGADFGDVGSGLKNATLYVYNSVGTLIGTNTTAVTGSFDSASLGFTFPSEGTYYWNYQAYDQVGNSAFDSANHTAIVDLSAPSITLNTPSNGTKTNIINQQFDANFSDNYELNNATLQIYNSLGTLIGTNTTTVSGTTDSAYLGFTLPGEGTYYWNYLVYDKAGNSNVSVSNYTLYIDTTNPVVNLTNPANDTWHNSDVWFKGDFEDPASGLKNATLYIWDSVGTLIHTNSTSISNFVNSSNMSYSFASEGTYYWNYEVYDIAGNSGWNSTNHSVNIDLSGPVVNLTTPVNETYSQQTNSFSADFTDSLSGLYNTTLYVWNNVGTLVGINSTNLAGSSDSATLDFTFPSEGTYYWNYKSYDKVGNSAFDSDNYTIHIDTTDPNVTLNNPSNDTKSNILSHSFNADFTDNYMLKNATLQIYDDAGTLIGSNSTTITGTSNASTLGYTFSSDGVYYWNYLVYDEAGNSNVSTNNHTIIIDRVKPIVNLSSPANNTYGGYTQVFAGNYSDDVELKNATLHVWNETGDLIGINSTNITGNINSSILGFTFPKEGIYYWNYLVYDEASNFDWNSTNYTIIIDLTPPQVNLISPANDTAIDINEYLFRANFTDAVKLKNATLQIYNSTGDLVGINSTNLDGIFNESTLNFTFPYEGTFYWNFESCDLVGNCNVSLNNRTIYVDFTAPQISFVAPTDANDSYVNRYWTYINISIYDLALESVELEWMGVNETLSCSSSSPDYSCKINKTMLKNGLYTYRVYANDTLGNTNVSDLRYININKTLPDITIISPTSGSKYNYNDTVLLNITTLIEANASWYEIDSNGTLYDLNKDSTLNWSSNISNLEGGVHSITFYANDSVDNIVNATSTFYVIPEKDIEVEKRITSIADNEYRIEINITNKGRWQDYVLNDFIDSNFSYYNLSPINDGITNIGGIYSGDILTWNISLAKGSSTMIIYNLNGSGDYNLENNYLIGLD